LKSIRLLALLLTAFATNALALEIVDYNGKSLAESITAGKKTLVWFHATWCATCKAQELVLAKIPKDQNHTVIIKVDFDTATKLRRELKVPTQSTFLVYKDGKEIARSVGVTDPAELKKLVGD
jgi:thiol-disulfide isomerase/thioredoxin